jgi:PIF1-like helicase
VQVWPRYRPDPDNAEIYEKYCYAKMILHHPFENSEDLLEGYDSWINVYEQTCLNNHDHNHPDDTLPKRNEDNLQDNESDDESIQGDPEMIYQPQWAAEAGRHPGQNISFTLDDLGLRDLDKDYDWIGNSSNDLEVLTSATKWLTDQVKESPNDDVQALPDVHYSQLKGEQRKVFLQVMAYFKKIRSNDTPKPPPLRINIDGTAGTGKSFLIWTITHALREMYSNEMVNKDPVVRLAPTGVAAFGIQGWTIHFGMAIPVKQGADFQQLSSSSLQCHQTRWSNTKLLILDEKSMIGRVQLGRSDWRLRQAFPQKADETLGGLPALFFGDFAQLPPIGDTPLFSNKDYEGTDRASLLQQGKTVYNSLTKSVTLTQIFRQEGEDPDQVKLRQALLNLRTYTTTEEDYQFFQRRMWNNLTVEERTGFKDALHLLPTKNSVADYNKLHLAQTAQPVLRCMAKHNCNSAKKASVDDADGLEPMVLLAEGAKVMITRNLWTSKGM